MKILLIDPPYERLIGFRSEWFPLGISYIASYLEGRGHEVGVYCADHGQETEYMSIVKYSENFNKYKLAIESDDHPVWAEIRKEVSKFKPEVVGISVMSPKVPSSFKIVSICKNIDPGIKVVFGGHHPTINPEEMLADQNVDFVVRGEGEKIFCGLIENLQKTPVVLHTIPGLSFRHNGKIVNNIGGDFIYDLDSLPLPARDKLFNLSTYTPIQLSMIMTSRGCPYRCGFCASRNMWKGRLRYRSVKNVINEIKELKNKYAVKNIMFMDDSFTIDRNRVKEMCQALIDERLDITWGCLTRVNIITDELVALMKKAGCTKMDVGIESGNPRILKLIQKDINLDMVRKAAEILRRNKMYWSAFFIFGFPTETKEEALDTLNFLKEIKPNWANISIFTPYPGTALFDLAKERGMISEPIDYTLYSHQNPHSRFTDTMPKEEMFLLATHILGEVHKYNSSYKSLARRVLTRNYHKNPRLFLSDFKKIRTWLKR